MHALFQLAQCSKESLAEDFGTWVNILNWQCLKIPALTSQKIGNEQTTTLVPLRTNGQISWSCADFGCIFTVLLLSTAKRSLVQGRFI